MKKYLVCSYDEPEEAEDGTQDAGYVEREEFQNFADAVAQYLFRCATRDDVILADLEKQSVIRQYAHAGTLEEDYGASDAICIF